MNAPEKKVQVFDPFKFLLKYFKFWPAIMGSILLFVGIGFYINKTTPPIYQVKGAFFVKEDDNSIGLLNFAGLARGISGKNEQWLVNQGVFLKSKPIAQRTLARLDHNVEYFEPQFFTDLELYKSSPIYVQIDWEHPQIIGDKIKISWNNDKGFEISFPGTDYFHFVPGAPGEEIEMDKEKKYASNFQDFTELPWLKIKVTLTKNVPEGEVLILLRSTGSLVSEYTSDNLLIFPLEENSSILGLSLDVSHPQKGADYLNTLMEVFLEIELEEKNRIARRTVDFIDAQIAGVSDTLSYFENNLQSFRASNRTYDMAVESKAIFDQITGLEDALSKERFNKGYFEELRNYLQRGTLEKIIAPAALGIDDRTLNTLIENLISLQTDRSNLLITQTDASPRVRELSRKIEDSSSSILEYIRNLSNTSQMRINDWETRINGIERQFSRLPSTEQNLVRIERGKNLNESIYNFLQQRRAEAAIAMASSFASNKIVEFAAPSTEPKKNKRNALYIIMAVFGLIFPVVVLFILEVIDTRIKDMKELEDLLSVPLLSKIPVNKTGSSLAVLNEPRSATAESFRALKTNISFVVPIERQLTIAVSSTIAGEGKTFTAINLASIYALNKKKTILVSCDMFKPNAMHDLQIKSKHGLSSYLSQQIDSVFDVIQKTENPNFDVIFAGAIPPNPSDLLASERFVQLLNELKKIYDVVVLDTPPVGLISQSFEIIKHVDLITYVFRYNFSEKGFISELNDIKLKKGIQNLYAILNGVPEKELTYKGLNYGYYDNSGRKKNTKKGKESLISAASPV
jgi:capsular exopolysaccharide synthesis family protein